VENTEWARLFDRGIVGTGGSQEGKAAPSHDLGE